MNATGDSSPINRAKPAAWLAAVLAILPWVWTVGSIPMWMSLLSATCAMAVIALYMYVGRSPRTQANESAGASAAGLQNFLHRWSGMAHQTQNNLHDVRQQIHGVMEQTEQAVLSLSGSFRNITAKTSEQMSHALNLLQSTHGIALNPEYTPTMQSLSLPEYLRTSEELVQRLANEIVRYSEMSLKLLLHENEMHAGDKRLDDTLNEIQTLARKIEAATSAGGTADEIAHLARHAVSASEDAQQRARGVRDARAGIYRSVAQIANEAKRAAESAKGEMTRVAGDMRKKNEEVAALVGRINTLGEEVRKDIYRVVVELQFQDITHQKLERVKTPLLNELGQGLRAIAQETHLLYEKLRRSVLDRGVTGGDKGGDNGAVAEPAPAGGEVKPVSAHHLQGAYQKPELGNKVELF